MAASVEPSSPFPTVAALLDWAFATHPRRVAVVDGESGATIPYAALDEQTRRLGAWLRGEGASPGDRVAFWAPNVPAVVAFAFGALRAGIAVTGLNPASTDREVAGQIDDAGVRALLAAPGLAAREPARGFRRLLVPGPAAHGTPLAEVLERAPLEAAGGAEPDRLALLPYSSGTTGMPKGVMLSHRNLVTVTAQLGERLGVGEGDVTIAAAPFFHILGFTATMLLPLARGATVVTMPRFDPLGLLRLIERYRVTYLVVPPPVASFLATHPAVDDHDLGSLRLIASGGAPLAADLHHRLAERLPGCAVGQGWGLTETSGAISVPGRDTGSPPGTVGRPLRDTEVRAVDPETGEPLAPGCDGELEMRGPQIMQGYLGKPVETRAMIGADGWLRTGDLGHVDADGNVVIVDRLKELIKVRGFQVAPAEVEAALVSHPAVADAAVVGRPDGRSGEAPVAFVVLRKDVEDDELRRWLGERLASYKQPADVLRVEALPRTPSGKLLRRLLRDGLREHAAGIAPAAPAGALPGPPANVARPLPD